MKVIRSEILGFCMGVRRALESAENALGEKKSSRIFSLGPLIHNEVALEHLENEGLKVLDENDFETLDENSSVIIRAHGISPEVLSKLKKTNCRILNATCPRVIISQRKAEQYGKDGYIVILAGDKDHGEVKGIAGYAGPSFVLLQSLEDAEKLQIPSDAKAVLLCQTTFSKTQYEKISNVLKEKVPGLVVLDTICPATRERQEALENLCPKVEGVIVIGGKKSANTIRLYEIARKSCAKAVHINSVSEIPDDFFKLQVVGITAGASTPDFLISQVEDALKKS